MSDYTLTHHGVHEIVESVNTEQGTIQFGRGYTTAGTPEVLTVLSAICSSAASLQIQVRIRGTFGVSDRGEICLLGFGLVQETAVALLTHHAEEEGTVISRFVSYSTNALGPVLCRRPDDITYYIGQDRLLQLIPTAARFDNVVTIVGENIQINGLSIFIVTNVVGVVLVSGTLPSMRVAIRNNHISYYDNRGYILDVPTQGPGPSTTRVEGVVGSIVPTRTGSARIVLLSNDLHLRYRSRFRYLNYDNSLAVGDVIVAELRPSRTRSSIYVLQNFQTLFQTPRKEPKVTPNAVMLLEDLVEDLETDLTTEEIKQRLLQILILENSSPGVDEARVNEAWEFRAVP